MSRCFRRTDAPKSPWVWLRRNKFWYSKYINGCVFSHLNGINVKIVENDYYCFIIEPSRWNVYEVGITSASLNWRLDASLVSEIIFGHHMQMWKSEGELSWLPKTSMFNNSQPLWYTEVSLSYKTDFKTLALFVYTITHLGNYCRCHGLKSWGTQNERWLCLIQSMFSEEHPEENYYTQINWRQKENKLIFREWRHCCEKLRVGTHTVFYCIQLHWCCIFENKSSCSKKVVLKMRYWNTAVNDETPLNWASLCSITD